MTPLTGTTRHNLDAKGRLVWPIAWRKASPGSLILTQAPGLCLVAFPPSVWERLCQQHGEDEEWLLHYVGSAHEVTPADMGRFLIPWELRAYAHLMAGREVRLMGVGLAAFVVGERGNRHAATRAVRELFHGRQACCPECGQGLDARARERVA